MTLGLTFMESHRPKIGQPSKYGATNHSNVLPHSDFFWEILLWEKVRQKERNQ